ncbi:MAG: SAM-dependent methyltransferase, partial [Candidatus Eremiobacteraeota bacterium]|nr:SAM-dependent methyltransferase [Candidatus Eremiobacteraeota bacterium]
FHWFANAAPLAEFVRILRPGGRLAIVWNERDSSGEFVRGFRELERRFAAPDMLAGADFSDATLEPLLLQSGFSNVSLLTFANAQRLDREGALGRMRSTSYAPRSGPELEELMRELDSLFERCVDATGYVDMPYVTEVWSATSLPA